MMTLACTICDSTTGQQVQRSILDEQFSANLLAVSLPFVIVLAVIATLHFALAPRREK